MVGHYSHVIQQEEYFKNKPIFHSLGSFVFDLRKPKASQSLTK
ncbi:MAG: CapA family protein [Bacteroides sp.]|nr:CapA family protein [Bacteroides sp.]